MSFDPASDPALAAATARRSRAAFVTAAVALGGTFAYGASHPDQFFHSYLLAFLFWNGLAVGSLAVLMLQYLTGGAWGIAIRRELEAATRTCFPGRSLAFVPIAFGMQRSTSGRTRTSSRTTRSCRRRRRT